MTGPLVLANDEIIAGGDNLTLCIEAEAGIVVWDLGKIREEEIGYYVTAVNATRTDLSETRKRTAAAALYVSGRGELTRIDCEYLCGLRGRPGSQTSRRR